MAKSPKAVDTSHGKVFERYFSTETASLDQKLPITIERVIDSAAAGSVIRGADCDFKLTIRGEKPGRPYHFLLEMKASVRFDTFGPGFKELIDSSQLARMKKAERAGSIGLYLFYSIPTGMVEVWDAHKLHVPYYTRGKANTLEQESPVLTVAKRNLRTWVSMTCANPEVFVSHIVGSRV